ncbi:MAG: hypothetical protein J6A75_02660 [Lachnospiraceae bacterium]|nr:hypothetical protein [Lachnospiraceae bacterium]
MSVKYGVFLARMQPVHNAHLFLVNKALEENDKVFIMLGSENKVDMLRNPYDIALREQMLRECFDEEQNEKITIATLPDWSMESDTESAKIWGRYFYYNVVSRIGQKCFSIYYSDDPAILDSWFADTEVQQYITYRNFERNNLFEGLSATKIRQAFTDNDVDYIRRYCPLSVLSRFDYLSSYYKDVTEHPREDFSME